jgi:hypothetical protein
LENNKQLTFIVLSNSEIIALEKIIMLSLEEVLDILELLMIIRDKIEFELIGKMRNN